MAREYTEKWHHQQQIRLVVGKEKDLLHREFYFPFLDTSMRALPYHYWNVTAGKNTLIKFLISGEIGTWYLLYSGAVWELLTECEIDPVSEVMIDQEAAWQIFTKGLNRTQARNHVQIKGNLLLGEHILDMLAVMA